MLPSHIGVQVRVPAAVLLIQVLANVPEKAVEDLTQVLGPMLPMWEA